MRNKTLLSVVIPAHNEEGGLRPTVDAVDRALTEAAIPFEILVVDDHSTDGTTEVLDWLKSKYPSLRTTTNSRPQGFGNAVQTALDEYRGDAFCIVPADGSSDPREIVAYYAKVREGFDCAFGSRFITGGASGLPLGALIVNRLANGFIRLLFGLRYNDITDPFKCYRRATIDGLRPIVSRHINVAAELPLKAITRGFSHAVVPVKSSEGAGPSKARIPGMASRYLFSVLYVLIEKLLSRGDYRRVAEPGGKVAEERPSMLMPWLAFALVVAVHLLFIKTYPLNDLGGDTPGYYRLLLRRISNLCHAPGYPFLAGLPLSIKAIGEAAALHGAAFRKILLFAQHAFDLLSLGVFMVVLGRVYNRLTAAIAVLIVGLSLQGMGVTSAVYPEWLQADLLLLTMSFALLAWRSETFRSKAFWYAMAFGAYTWMYFVKFNAIVVLPVLLFVIAVERLRWRDRARVLAIAAAFAFVNYAAFVGLYHRPKTGTADLSYDRSWVLMTRLSAVYHRLPYPEGIHTKRWLAFAARLPQSYNVASSGPFDHIDVVPAEIRAPYRGVAAEILGADEAGLDRILRSYPAPANFSVAMSSIPISWYVGLKVSDDLGIKVFRESVLHHPREFIASTARMTLEAMRVSTIYPIFPTTADTPQLCEKLIQEDASHLRLVQRADQSLPYRYSEPVVWSPGYSFFSAMSWISSASHRLLLAMVVLGFLAAAAAGVVGGWDDRVMIPLILAVLLAVFVVFSNAVLEFRWKEMRFAFPLIATVIGVTVGWTVPELIRRLSASRVHRPSAATEP